VSVDIHFFEVKFLRADVHITKDIVSSCVEPLSLSLPSQELTIGLCPQPVLAPFVVHRIIIIPHVPRFAKWSLLFRFCNYPFLCVCQSCYAHLIHPDFIIIDKE
jgi:hypothetical protein